jgi:mRNA degradation ribonuclease J1/J2
MESDIFLNLGYCLNLGGLYAKDYAKHMSFDDEKDNEVDGVRLTHAHIDHAAYTHPHSLTLVCFSRIVQLPKTQFRVLPISSNKESMALKLQLTIARYVTYLARSLNLSI